MNLRMSIIPFDPLINHDIICTNFDNQNYQNKPFLIFYSCYRYNNASIYYNRFLIPMVYQSLSLPRVSVQ